MTSHFRLQQCLNSQIDHQLKFYVRKQDHVVISFQIALLQSI